MSVASGVMAGWVVRKAMGGCVVRTVRGEPTVAWGQAVTRVLVETAGAMLEAGDLVVLPVCVWSRR